MRITVSAAGLLTAMLASVAMEAAASTPVRLAPHRAVYDLSLVRSEGPRGIESVKGRIAMEFGGDACEGYTLKYRQVTILQGGETGSRTMDTQTATYEAGDGRSMRFKSTSLTQGLVKDSEIDGDARLRPDGSLDVRFKQPKSGTFEAAGQPVFPTEHLKRLIEAGRKGEAMLAVRVYDGSDNGRKIYDTLGLIGRRIEPGAGKNLEESVRQDILAGVPRWPVTISYFDQGKADREPVYKISFELYENGISRSLTLDYGDFAVRGELKSLDVQAPTSCQR